MHAASLFFLTRAGRCLVSFSPPMLDGEERLHVGVWLVTALVLLPLLRARLRRLPRELHRAVAERGAALAPRCREGGLTSRFPWRSGRHLHRCTYRCARNPPSDRLLALPSWCAGGQQRHFAFMMLILLYLFCQRTACYVRYQVRQVKTIPIDR